MNIKILEIIEPLAGGWGVTFWLSTLIALVAGGALWYLLSGKPASWTQNIRLLVAMLAFFTMLIAGGTAFFQGWAQIKKSPVVFYEEQFQTSFGSTLYSDVTLIRREMIEDKAPFNQNITRGEPVWFLVIKGKGAQVHMLSEQDYPIDRIAEKLRSLVNKDSSED